MSDLSKPALSLLPKQADAHTPNVWPVPPFAAYAPARAFSGPKECEVEGPNGKVTRGRLVAIDWQAGVAQVQVPPARGNLPLRFAHFRRLTLVKPLAALAPATYATSHRRATCLRRTCPSRRRACPSRRRAYS